MVATADQAIAIAKNAMLTPIDSAIAVFLGDIKR